VPVTYPPAPVNGVMVSDFLTPRGKTDFIYPKALFEEIESRFGKYPLYFRMPIASPNLSDTNTETFLKELNDIMEYKFRVARFLYDRYESDLLMLHIWGTDRIQHELWNFFDEGHRQFRKDKKEKFYDKILSYYQKVDSEIDALINAVRELLPGKHITGVFQPHLYSRTRDFADDFAKSLSALDHIVLTDIYPAREKAIEGITSEWLLKKIDSQNKEYVPYGKIISKVCEFKDGVILTIGAGNIDKLVSEISVKLKQC